MKKRILSGLLAVVLTLSAEQGLVFAAPLQMEGGEAYAAELDVHFTEMEAERERMEAEMEAEREELLKHIIHKPEHAKDFESGDGSLGIAAEKYSEIVYISTVDELLAIDGHSGGYYELTADIDLSGMEWEPLYLENATFNGKGHTIKNLKLNSSTDIIGFFSGGNIYLYDAKFKNAEIDEIKYRSISEISLLGSVYADSCTVEGQINVSSIDEIRIYGLNSGVDCQLRIDIAARGSDAHVFGMVNCINCEY